MFYILIGVIALASWIVSNTLQRKFKKYSQISLRNGMSGAEIAEKMLADHGITDVQVISTPWNEEEVCWWRHCTWMSMLLL